MNQRTLGPWAAWLVLGLLVALAAALTWWLGRQQPASTAAPAAAASRAQMLTGRLDTALLRRSAQSAAASFSPQFAVMPFDAPAGDEELQGLAESLCDALLELMTRGEAPSASACNSTRVAAQVGMSPSEVATMWVTGLWLPELAGLRAHPGFVPYLHALGLPALWQAHGAPDRCEMTVEQVWRCS